MRVILAELSQSGQVLAGRWLQVDRREGKDDGAQQGDVVDFLRIGIADGEYRVEDGGQV